MGWVEVRLAVAKQVAAAEAVDASGCRHSQSDEPQGCYERRASSCGAQSSRRARHMPGVHSRLRARPGVRGGSGVVEGADALGRPS